MIQGVWDRDRPIQACLYRKKLAYKMNVIYKFTNMVVFKHLLNVQHLRIMFRCLQQIKMKHVLPINCI